MSDFFTRLAERTLGLALTIQPIKPSLFAPEPNYDGETLLEIAEESSAAQTFSNTPPVAEIPALPPDSDRMAAQERAVETAIMRSEHAQAEQPLSAATPERQSIDSISVATPINSMNDTRPRSNIKQQQPARYNHRHVSAAEPRSANAAQARGFTPVIREIDSASTRAPTPAISHTYGEAPDTVLSSSLTEQEHSNDTAKRSAISDNNTSLDGDNTSERYMEATTLVETSTLLHEQTISHHAILGERSGHSPQSPISTLASRTQPEASTPESAIQVTIGRVEVRAVTAPTPTARQPQQSARSSAMSLDEYLRRQEQGGRR